MVSLVTSLKSRNFEGGLGGSVNTGLAAPVGAGGFVCALKVGRLKPQARINMPLARRVRLLQMMPAAASRAERDISRDELTPESLEPFSRSVERKVFIASTRPCTLKKARAIQGMAYGFFEPWETSESELLHSPSSVAFAHAPLSVGPNFCHGLVVDGRDRCSAGQVGD